MYTALLEIPTSSSRSTSPNTQSPSTSRGNRPMSNGLYNADQFFQTIPTYKIYHKKRYEQAHSSTIQGCNNYHPSPLIINEADYCSIDSTIREWLHRHCLLDLRNQRICPIVLIRSNLFLDIDFVGLIFQRQADQLENTRRRIHAGLSDHRSTPTPPPPSRTYQPTSGSGTHTSNLSAAAPPAATATSATTSANSQGGKTQIEAGQNPTIQVKPNGSTVGVTLGPPFTAQQLAKQLVADGHIKAPTYNEVQRATLKTTIADLIKFYRSHVSREKLDTGKRSKQPVPTESSKRKADDQPGDPDTQSEKPTTRSDAHKQRKTQ